jgi:hypothetical protein
MNWKQGLYRAWMIGSVIWIAYLLWELVLVCRFAYSNNQPPLCQDPHHGDLSTWLTLAILGIGGPLAVLVLGHVLNWIRRGFADTAASREGPP